MEYKLRHQIREILRKYMFDEEINQSQLAKKLGINRSLVSQIMNEKRNISLDVLEEYCKKLEIEIKITYCSELQ